MKSSQQPPSYPHQRVQQIDSLARLLGVSTSILQSVAKTADSRYRLAKPIIKADGSTRQPVDALEPLKGIQRRIKERILEKVIFPEYLTGSLKGRDARKNAQLHEGAGSVVCEDIEGFFPNTSVEAVHSVWTGFFRFSSEVASVLTSLTVKDGSLPQGACTSSYIANLVFWRREHALYLKLHERGISYSRFVDDVTASSPTTLSNDEIAHCISQIYGMMLSCGYKAKREKQDIQRPNRAMRVTKLNVNSHAAIPSAERQAIRAAVHELENRVAAGDLEGIAQALNSATGRVGRLGQMHSTEAQALKNRLSLVRRALAT